MDILPIILFLLGVGFLFVGWRWQNPPNEEAMTALKGLAYLKREVIRVQDKVLDLENKLLESKEIDLQKVEHREVDEKEAQEPESNKQESKQLYPSSEYQEVLELAANGQRIPEIAQRLFLSQDEVGMVLKMQSKGETL